MNHKCAYHEIKDNPILLDFGKCKYLGEIHAILKEKFGLPEYYGENPDALWDLLDGRFDGMGTITAQIKGFYALNDALQDACLPLMKVLDDVQATSPNFSYRIIS